MRTLRVDGRGGHGRMLGRELEPGPELELAAGLLMVASTARGETR